MAKNKLKSLAKAKGLTLYELADVIGVSRQQIYNWSIFKNIPSPTNIRKMALVLGVSIKELILYFYGEELYE